MFLQDRKEIAVIVTNHNYLHFLNDALSSIKAQILTPTEVVVIDDASNESCEDLVKHYGYQYIKTEHANPLLARQTGFKATTSEYVCFLDADDKIPPSYLAQAILTVNKNVHIAFSDIHYFGNRSDTTNYHDNIPPKRLWQVNFLHVGCVVSRIAIELSDAFSNHPQNQDYHEDWMFWRKIVGYGFKYAKHNVPYEARSHATNRSTSIRNKGYIHERAVSNFEKVPHSHNKNQLEFLKFLNFTASHSTGDYVCLHRHKTVGYGWDTLITHLDHDVAIVHDGKYELFDRTLIVGQIFRDYIYTDLKQLPFDTKTEKIITI